MYSYVSLTKRCHLYGSIGTPFAPHNRPSSQAPTALLQAMVVSSPLKVLQNCKANLLVVSNLYN
jgi:hypothetical protein